MKTQKALCVALTLGLLVILSLLSWTSRQADGAQAGMKPHTERVGSIPAASPTPTSSGTRLVFVPMIFKTYFDLSQFIPAELAGYPSPMTSSFSSAEPLDGLTVPGGYVGREWLDEAQQRFVLTMVMSWLTPQAATQQLSLIKPAHAVPAGVGEEGYVAETADTDGEPAFRLLVFRRASYLVLVGSGILDAAAAAPAESVIMELGAQIDARLGGTATVSTPASASMRQGDGQSPVPAPAGAMPAAGQTIVVGNCLSSAADLASLRGADALTSSTTVTGTLKLSNGRANGEITLRFDVTDLGPGRDCPTCQVQGHPAQCHLLEVRVYITKIKLGAYDGDGEFRGDGDIMVGGQVNVHFNCNGAKTGSLSFVTGELGDIGPNSSKQLEKYLGTVVGCQCPGSSPTTTFDLLVRDHDGGDAVDIIQVVEAIVVKKYANDETAKRLDGLKDAAKDKGQDTTGPDPFRTLRERAGDDVGESHRSDPAPIGR